LPDRAARLTLSINAFVELALRQLQLSDFVMEPGKAPLSSGVGEAKPSGVGCFENGESGTESFEGLSALAW
jgi:hypothetical protein